MIMEAQLKTMADDFLPDLEDDIETAQAGCLTG